MRRLADLKEPIGVAVTVVVSVLFWGLPVFFLPAAHVSLARGGVLGLGAAWLLATLAFSALAALWSTLANSDRRVWVPWAVLTASLSCGAAAGALWLTGRMELPAIWAFGGSAVAGYAAGVLFQLRFGLLMMFAGAMSEGRRRPRSPRRRS